jgi:hypothetical protein
MRLPFEDNETRNEEIAELEKITQKGDTRDMFKNIQIHIDNAQLSGAGSKNLILDDLPETLFGQMHTTDRKGKSDQEIIEIILKDGKPAKMCGEAWSFSPKNS